MATTNSNTIPLSIGNPGGGGVGGGGGGVSTWATDTRPMKKNKIEANIFLFSMLLNNGVKVKKKLG